MNDTAAVSAAVAEWRGNALLEHYMVVLLCAGLLILLVAWFPLLTRRWPLTLPILCVAIGPFVLQAPMFKGLLISPVNSPVLVEKACELIVIVSLMGAGLKITWGGIRTLYAAPLRLLLIAMPLSILAITWLGMATLGLSLAAALLLGACLAPTDPVLASEVQIQQQSDKPTPIRFALTSEAGLNDALAFPFVHLALVVAAHGLAPDALKSWALESVLIKLSVGALVGLCGGWLLGWLVYTVPQRNRLSRTGDGFVALGATLTIYGAAEISHGYGFLAVFIAGLMLRHASDGHRFNHTLHAFTDETERLLMMALLIVFSAMAANHVILNDVHWSTFIFAGIVAFVVRPLVAMLSLWGLNWPLKQKAAMAFFGIKGLGSVYYLAYAGRNGSFEGIALLWDLVALVVLLSIVVHGVAASLLMPRIERERPPART
jgi:NhaP-type Na+/H+ or K+/H+ antiporter